jgi:FkbM family methyltransferase
MSLARTAAGPPAGAEAMVSKWARLRGEIRLAARAFAQGVGFDRVRLAALALQGLRDSLRPRAATALAMRLRHAGRSATIHCRMNPSDTEVFREVFLEASYDVPESLLSPPATVLDLGAHVGLSSARFALRYPEAFIVAVEALSDNAELLRRTARGFGPRFQVVEAAVQARPGTVTFYSSDWSTSGTALPDIARKRQGDPSRAEAKTARPPVTVRAITVPELMAQFKIARIDLLKMDIEGAEEQLLNGPPPWLRDVKVVVAEIHDKYIDGAAVRRSLADAGLEPHPPRRGRTELFVRR